MRPAENIEKLIKKLQVVPRVEASKRNLDDALAAQKKSKKINTAKLEPDTRSIISWRKVSYPAAAFLIISSWLACFVLSKKVDDLKNELQIARHDVATAGTEESAIINIYAREHQDVVARYASLSPAQPEPMQIQVNQNDILYYEHIDDQPEYTRPGIIVRRSSHQDQINTSQNPAISNGHILTLSEAREASDFDLVSPSWLLSCYRLDQIRIIEGRDTFQLLYTNGINSISLFEQSLDGQRGLSHHDFREYAVYSNTEQEGVTILAWRNDALSYVLIGNTELSQLMDMAQSINAAK